MLFLIAIQGVIASGATSLAAKAGIQIGHLSLLGGSRSLPGDVIDE
jgi:hypothetical protein